MEVTIAAFLLAKRNVNVNHKKRALKNFRAQIYSN
jgi:hypothetical protein